MNKFLIIFVFIPLSANAFINIESLRENSKKGFNSSAKALFNQQTGNTDKLTASASSLNAFERFKDEYIIIANMQYGESFEQKDTENGSLHLRYTRELSSKNYTELYTQYQYNKFKALNSRKLLGIGYRHKAKYINVGLGAFSEYEEISDRPNQEAIRGNFYFSSSIKNQTGLEVSSILYLQPSFKNANDTRVTLNAGISSKISNDINIIIEYESVYDEEPPEDIKSSDTSLMFGLNFIL